MNDDQLRPSTMAESEGSIKISHEISVEVHYEMDPIEGAGQESVTSKKESNRQKVFIVTRPLNLYSVSPDLLYMSAYIKILMMYGSFLKVLLLFGFPYSASIFRLRSEPRSPSLSALRMFATSLSSDRTARRVALARGGGTGNHLWRNRSIDKD